MLPRRLVGAAVLLVWLTAPVLAALPEPASHGACTDHVCACTARHCPPRRPAGESCHEGSGPASSAMTSRCDHDSDPVPVALRTQGIPIPATEIHAGPEADRLGPAVSPRPAAGHRRFDPRPPKPASE
jgi:hypothetical protein